ARAPAPARARPLGARRARGREARLRTLGGGAAAVGERPGGGECAPLRGHRGGGGGRVPEAARDAAIISPPPLEVRPCRLRSCSPVRAHSRSGCCRRSPPSPPCVRL